MSAMTRIAIVMTIITSVMTHIAIATTTAMSMA